MISDENNTDDLEYLARLGFDKVEVKEAELRDLKKKVRARTFTFNKLVLALSSLLLGALIGAFLFFIISQRSSGNEINLKSAERSVSSADNKVIKLDTIVIGSENFINPAVAEKKTRQKEKGSFKKRDSADIIPSRPIDLSALTSGTMHEDKLKFIINSPVFYLHDMKVTNYTTLYFKRNQFVPFSGLSADHSNHEETDPGSNLKQSATYFLHEEIAKAMLYFKRELYDKAINSLKTVSTYNQEDLNCSFYLAMSYYYKRNFVKAIELFDVCIENPNNTFLQESAYYKAVSLHESGNKNQALPLFQKIADENEFYSEKAKAYLKE